MFSVSDTQASLTSGDLAKQCADLEPVLSEPHSEGPHWSSSGWQLGKVQAAADPERGHSSATVTWGTC